MAPQPTTLAPSRRSLSQAEPARPGIEQPYRIDGEACPKYARTLIARRASRCGALLDEGVEAMSAGLSSRQAAMLSVTKSDRRPTGLSERSPIAK
jgi:hypothetical protein